MRPGVPCSSAAKAAAWLAPGLRFAACGSVGRYSTTSPRHPSPSGAHRGCDAVAAQVFAEQGLDTAPAAIAKQAGVGVGTLYRHFPTREALIDAAYRHQLTLVCGKASGLLTRIPVAEATQVWMEHFLDYATTKSGMSAALNAVIASGVAPAASPIPRSTAPQSRPVDS
ncbi:TetR/AcrR family transcriptional regulator [Streptomyces tubercidicus]